MAKPVHKHQEDDGDLSIFASGDTVVLACEYGHYWVLEAKMQTSETVRKTLEDVLPADEAERMLRAF